MARTAISAPLRANPRRCYSWSPCIALLAEDATDTDTDTDTKLSSFAALLTDGLGGAVSEDAAGPVVDLVFDSP